MASTIDAYGQKAIGVPHGLTQRVAEFVSAQQRQLILFAPVALAGGIGLWFALPFNGQRQAALIAGLALALLGLAASGFARRLIVVLGLLLALGVGAAEFRSAQVAAPRLHHRLTPFDTSGTVLAVRPQQGGARQSILLLRDATAVDPAVTVRLSLHTPPPGWLRPGARIAGLASLGPPPAPAVPGGYDPGRRAWFEGVSATGRFFGDIRLLAPAPGGPPPLAAIRARGSAATMQALGGDAGAIAVALIYGEQGHIRPDLLEAMRTAGLAHILTVSGFHIAVVVGGVLLLLRRLLALWPWLALRFSVTRIAAVGAGVAGTLYMLLSGADLPAVRATIAAWVVLGALMLGRDPLSLRLIGFAALLILLARPEALLNPSFQLSFAAVTALAALAASELGAQLRAHREDGPLRRLGRHVAALVMTGLVVELALTPIVLAHFGRAGVYGLFANLLAIPLTGLIIMPLLGLWLALSLIGLGPLVAPPLRWSLNALAGIGETVAGWPGASVQLAAMPMPALLVMLAGGLLIALLTGRARWLGLQLVLAGALAALLAPRPNLFISADGRQVAVVADGRLHTLRGHRDGFLIHSWSEQAAAAPTARLSDLPGARCAEFGCEVALPGLRLLALTDDLPADISRRCARADLVTAPLVLHSPCAPRGRKLDKAALRLEGAVAIRTVTGRFDSVARRAGDQPWSPSALPGLRPRLLGGMEWTGVISE
ncbi:ComEC/Rec2 family competence protein [Sandaracinobacter neustonicus]|uniref:ComEC/Rec2 family competence protein n=1 Tax=Sandaracinobacter neustonicus TaxID=1715348 RepID=A0A501XKG0_9SPHN|nr:ComEC/Rec2 family competence protein [Sandaracinobacter neustonicus]TPE61151.1 ComEC/Rec2 family competence protein [Sandaracinobacter neustonicus]